MFFNNDVGLYPVNELPGNPPKIYTMFSFSSLIFSESRKLLRLQLCVLFCSKHGATAISLSGWV